jgi:hypothetical protein
VLQYSDLVVLVGFDDIPMQQGGDCMYALSRTSTATYSSSDSLKMFFFLSMIFIVPLGYHSPISPAHNKAKLDVSDKLIIFQ